MRTRFESKYGKRTILSITIGDITRRKTDALITPALPSLKEGEGVNKAIHSSGGWHLEQECKAYPKDSDGFRCPVGEAVITHGGNLPNIAVVHAVVPEYNESDPGDSAAALDKAYYYALYSAMNNGMETLSIAAVHDYPSQEASEIVIKAIADFLQEETHTFREIEIVLFSKESYVTYADTLKKLRRPVAHRVIGYLTESEQDALVEEAKKKIYRTPAATTWSYGNSYYPAPQGKTYYSPPVEEDFSEAFRLPVPKKKVKVVVQKQKPKKKKQKSKFAVFAGK